MGGVGYLPYVDGASVESSWLADHLGVAVEVPGGVPALNDVAAADLPPLAEVVEVARSLCHLDAVVAEGPAGCLWAAVLRTTGFTGTVTVLPYLNPHRWIDVAAVALHRRLAGPTDRVLVGSTPSARLWAAHGVATVVGEPYGIDDAVFRPRPGAERVRAELGIPAGPLLLHAGRAQPDKDLYAVLRTALRARLLVPDLQVVVASHVVDDAYFDVVRAALGGDDGVHVVLAARPEQLADLYAEATVFVTASTSHFETFGRAPAEALACGTPVVAPRYDGFAEVLAQPGGRLVDVPVHPATGAPLLDDAAFLRAVYEVVSGLHPVDRSAVAEAARRFGRSRTIRLLDHLGGSAPPPEPVLAAPPGTVLPELPDRWRRALDELDRRPPAEAVAAFWHGHDHADLAGRDPAFALAVRGTLCRPDAMAAGVDAGRGWVTCP